MAGATFFAVPGMGQAPAKPAARPPAPAPEPAFSFATVQRMAAGRAAEPYKDRSPKLPDVLARQGYDEYRDIRFRPASALWRGEALFEVQFYHRGSQFSRRVNINEVTASGVHPLPYTAAAFTFGRNRARGLRLPVTAGFAGFRVHFPLHSPAYKDELISFLGASYFKVLGRNQGYGISVRGIAVDTASQSGEEFPEFTDFWLLKPPPGQQALIIYGLLDSKSLAGAYRFELRPGANSQVYVSAVLYPRRDIAKLGIAPLTSMFFYGENHSGRRFDDFRPEVHDSDGLAALTGRGEWLWRPVVNHRKLQISRFVDENPRGFGLYQRDRDFSHYQDNEARYERRPSYWVMPVGQWGKGSVELVEIPTENEFNDNIVAYWVPDAPVKAGQPVSFSYVLTSYLQPRAQPDAGLALSTRLGRVLGSHPQKKLQDMRRVVVDFAGGELDGLARTQPVKADVTARGGEIDEVIVERLTATNVWRAAFHVLPKNPDEPVDLRCRLTLYGQPLTETWLYLWTP